MASALLACAAVQEPPGGPPDTTPPAIVATRPDSGAVVPGWHDALVIQFNEVIDERSGGGLDKLITLSPVSKQLDVNWKRSAIAVKPKDGWRQGVVYQLALQPGITDLRNNRAPHGRTIVFSTGNSIPATRITGTVVDWEQGRLAARALVEAIRLPDSLRYLGSADSVGDFVLASVPVGRYRLMAAVDGNNNRKIDPREPLDSATVQLDSTVSRTFWAFRHDTLGPTLSRVLVVDTVTLRLEFNQALPPAGPDSGAVTVLALPDSTPLRLAHVWRLPAYDSVAAAERSRRAQAADTTKADTAAGRAPAPVLVRRPAPAAPAAAPAPDTSRVARLLVERPKLSSTVIVRLEAPLAPGGRYLVVARVKNMTAAEATSRSMVVIPPRAAPRP